MTKRDIFEELVSIRTLIEKGDATESDIVDFLQNMIWKLGLDIGEF